MTGPATADRRSDGAGSAAVSIIGVIVGFIVLWEGYKFIWGAASWDWPVDPSNRSMPHSWDIVLALLRPAQRSGQGVEISPDAYRTDLAEAAIANLDDMDTDGAGFERIEVELQENGG